MTKHLFVLLSAAALFVCGTAIGWTEGLSPEVKAQLCQEKKAGLAKLEAEAPQVRADLAKKEAELENVRREMDKWDALAIGVAAGAVPAWLQLTAKAVGLNPKAYVNIEHDKHADKAGPLRDEIRTLKRRQTEVGNQIFLLRDSIESLRCDTLPPPVDYNAINQHTQQFQQSGPGAGQGTSGQSAQPQSSTYTAPSTGFGTPTAPSQSPGSPGYPPAYGGDPYGGSSPQLPTHQQILQGVQGSIGDKPGMSKPGSG